MSLRWGVLGGGAFGTALANTLGHAGNSVTIWDRDPLVVDDINTFHQNRKRYADVSLHENVKATMDVEKVAEVSDLLLIAVPSEVNAVLAVQVGTILDKRHRLVISSKGFRESDGALLSNVWREIVPQVEQVAVITGPTFAREIMEKKVTAMLVASTDEALRADVASSFDTDWVRMYENDDLVGAQVGGAVKNVLAIAAGILDGLELGYNARAAMLTRGLGEMARFSKALGGKSTTIWGLAGMGDLLLTATSTLSRNYRFGQLVGKGMPVHEAKMRVGTVEGILAARIVTVQAQAHGLDLAIVSAVDGILHGDVTPLKAIEYLMQRPRVQEFGA